MSAGDQLERERRLALPAALAAIGAAALLIGATVYLQSSLEERPDGDAELLRTIDSEESAFVVSGVLQALGLAALAGPLLYLLTATRARRPQTSRLIAFLVVAGPLAAAILAVVRQLMLTDLAADFVGGAGEGRTPDERADNLIDESDFPTLGGVGFVANVTLGLGVVLVALNAMRAGLTSRFLGILGIIIGVLYVIPVAGGPQIVQLFWLGALAALFLNRWPGGRGPAWTSGEAEAWPTAADRARELEEGRSGASAGASNGGAPEAADPDVPRQDRRPRSRKRKRKR